MRRSLKLFFLLLISFVFQIEAQEITVTVDPRVELLSIIFRLAGNPEYNMCRIPSYNSAVDNYFNKYKDHPLIKFAIDQRSAYGISFDACMSMAVHINNIDSVGERGSFDFPGIALEKRWRVDDARKFLKLAKHFVIDTKFMDFFNSQKELYDNSIERMVNFMQSTININWFEKYFGEKAKGDFNVVLGMCNGAGNYGVKFVTSNGSEELYAIMGIYDVDKKGIPKFDPSFTSTIVHEFSHSFINHIVEKHKYDFEKAGSRLFDEVKSQMKRQAYGNWKTMMDESLVRASVIRYSAENPNPYVGANIIMQMQIKIEIKNSFLWIEELTNLLEVYEKSREKYSTLESYLPVIAKYFNELTGRFDDLKKKIEKTN